MFFGPLRRAPSGAGRTRWRISICVRLSPSRSTTTALPRDAARRHADGYAFTIGAMGGAAAISTTTRSPGYGEQVGIVAELWQSGKRDEARQAVPIDLAASRILLVHLTASPSGSPGTGAAGITTLLAEIEGDYPHQLATLERLLDIVADG